MHCLKGFEKRAWRERRKAMNIFVCIKQVPSTNKVQVDEKTGVLKRNGIQSKMNPYDMYALATALRLRPRRSAAASCVRPHCSISRFTPVASSMGLRSSR